MRSSETFQEIVEILDSDESQQEKALQLFALFEEAAKPVKITYKTYQIFQREYEQGKSPSELEFLTPFARTSLYRLRKDYDNKWEYYKKFAAHHDVNEQWQRQVPCPEHPYIDWGQTTKLFQFDVDTNRVECQICNWYQDFPRYPAIKEEK